MSDDLSTIAADLAPTGVLRASINLGNPVLAQGTPDAPSGVTVDLARALAGRLGLPVELLCFDAARKSFEALTSGRADVGFLAVEPARAEQVAFTAPYVLIEGVYAVPDDSPLRTVEDVDAEGVRIGVKLGSAYDLFLTRTLRHADLVRGEAEHGGVPGRTARGRGRHPAADDRLRRRSRRGAADRAAVHGDPPGDGDDPVA